MTTAQATMSSRIESSPTPRSREAMAARAVTAATIGTALEWFEIRSGHSADS